MLLGATKYGPAIDMWSVGCIFAELLNGKPILPGKTEVRLSSFEYGRCVLVQCALMMFTRTLLKCLFLQNEQLNKIYELCGSPDENNWPGVSKMPWYNQMKPSRQLKRRVREIYRQ